MMDKFLDEYELKARIAPGLIVALPALVDVIYVMPALSSLPIFAASGIITLALIYGLGYVIRAEGQQVEPALWRQWGGPPSTRLMRSSDTFFGADLKNSIRSAVRQEFAVSLPTPAEEKKDTARADKAIADAFERVRGFLRSFDPTGVWQKNNIEYGFCRNLLGGRMLWAFVAVGSIVVAVWRSATTHSGFFNPAVMVSCLSLACAGYVGWRVLPKATKRIAERYAELAWTTFLQLSKDRSHIPVSS
ncbi:MAG: hypothetical protein ABSF92_00420 [Candidatus Acidiferrales bacterium]|jgi:hypothetical protein